MAKNFILILFDFYRFWFYHGFVMKNGKINGNGWFSYSEYKKDMLSLFEEALKGTKKDIKTIKKTLTNHLADDHKKINKKLDQIIAKLK